MFTTSLSVRDLVEFIYQSGDLIAVASNLERAHLGSRIHRMLQSQATGDYQSEVYLKEETILDDMTFIIDGRADGIRRDGEQVTIEEIKTTAIPYDAIDDTHFVHFAQAYCYAYMYCRQHELAECTINLRYYQIDIHKTKDFQQQKTFADLEQFYMETLQAYMKWAALSKNIRITSTNSLKKLAFPFEAYRMHQRTFAVAVYKSILEKQHLFAQAPTGIGKTISTLFPALKAVGERKIEKIFYLCAKNVTAQVAYDTIALLQKQDVSFKSVALTAKDKICCLPERNCDPNHCPYAKGYYDRNKNALYELLCEQDMMDKECISRKALEHTICPFELSLDASLYADVIICDYNYVFDPRVYLKRFFMEKGSYAFLVDEAHNLVDRAREMYSAQISKAAYTQIRKYIPKESRFLLQSIRALSKELTQLSKHCETIAFRTSSEPNLELIERMEDFVEHMSAYLQDEHDLTHEEELKDVYFQSINYIRISEFYDEHFITCFWKEGKDLLVKQYCMNPCNPLKTMMAKGRSTIYFSATLSPIDYFLSLLGGSEDTRRLALPSPFASEHVNIIINDAISTRYNDRQRSMIDIIETIHASVLPKAGNYIVFLPSYAYMNLIAEAFKEAYPAMQISIQGDHMSNEEKTQFLDSFDETATLHIRFCVLGGMFSEGIDLKGEKLLGTMIIGVGLPQINPMQDLIRDHFNEINHMGYAYAYQFPGMNKVLQAAGRVIRSIHDRGIIVLIDDRFTSPFYQQLFPAHMRHYKRLKTPQEIYLEIMNFWNA